MEYQEETLSIIREHLHCTVTQQIPSLVNLSDLNIGPLSAPTRGDSETNSRILLSIYILTVWFSFLQSVGDYFVHGLV